MGMKKSSVLGLMAMAMMMDSTMHQQGSVATSKPIKPLPKKEPTPFHKEDGISKMIEDYKNIQLGVCKKSKRKQQRVLSKIKVHLDNGILTEEHLKL